MYTNAFIVGLVISVILGINITVTEIIWPSVYAHDYPKAIQERAVLNPVTKNDKLQSMVFLIICYLLALAALIVSYSKIFYNPSGFFKMFLYTYTVFMVFNIFDLLILDWLIFNTITPKCICLPGTYGMKEYKNYLFNFVGFLKGIVICGVLALVVSGIGFGVFKIWIW